MYASFQAYVFCVGAYALLKIEGGMKFQNGCFLFKFLRYARKPVN